MSGVKIKKSVLQSIIKKHLFESPAPDSGVSRRLTVGPDRSSLPTGLPLSPSDRMSVQLDVERPPVDDPDYMPENPRELGYAVQALAEMVPTEHVEKVYREFQRVLESLEDEGVEDEDLLKKFESVYRRGRIMNLLVREAAGDFDEEVDEEELARLEAELGSELRQQARVAFAKPDANNASIMKISDSLNALGVKNDNLIRYITKQISDNEGEDSPSGLTSQDFVMFMDLYLKNMADAGIRKMFEKVLRDSDSHRDSSKWDIMVQFIQSFPQIVANREQELLSSRQGTRADPKKFEYQTAAKKYGHAAASGLRQAFIRDVLGVRSILPYITTREINSHADQAIRRAFLEGFDRPENQEFLLTLFEDEGGELENFKNSMKRPDFFDESLIYQNFAGLIYYDALSTLADLSFKSKAGKPGRKIGLAFQTEFGDDNAPLGNDEKRQLSAMIDKDEFLDDFISPVLEGSREEHGYRNFITAAAKLSEEDTYVEEAGPEGRYEEPAFATLKKAASSTKPAWAHFEKDHPMFEPLKAADTAARKLAKQKGRGK
jgi:hypothetical protein